MVAHPDAAGRGGEAGAELRQMGRDREASSASPLSAAPGPAAQGRADGLYRLSGRIPRRREDTQSIMSPGAHSAGGPR